jgi:hypothetical protein
MLADKEIATVSAAKRWPHGRVIHVALTRMISILHSPALRYTVLLYLPLTLCTAAGADFFFPGRDKDEAAGTGSTWQWQRFVVVVVVEHVQVQHNQPRLSERPCALATMLAAPITVERRVRVHQNR